MQHTHTFVVVDISSASYLEILSILMANGYQQAVKDRQDGDQILDMHGLALRVAEPPAEARVPPLRGELIQQMLKQP